MPAPVVEATNESSVVTAGTSHQVNLPAFPGGVAACIGKLLLIMVNKGVAVATFNALAGWNELLDENLANGMVILYREVDGSEGASVTFTSSANTRSAHISYLIAGNAPGVAPTLSTVATGTSTGPDATSVSAAASNNSENLYVSVFGCAGEEADDDTWCNTAPTGYSGLLQKSCTTAGTSLGGIIAAAWRQAGAASEDPGAFNQDASLAWRAFTIAITSATVATPLTPPAETFLILGPGGLRKFVRLVRDPAGAAAAAYELEASPGSYVLTGLAASLVAGRVIVGAPGSYVLTGQAASVVAGRAIVASPGAYVLTGTAASLLAGRMLSAAAGSYDVTGALAALAAGRVVVASAGSYAVTGTSAAVVADRVISANPGAYTVTGFDVALVTVLEISAEPGVYELTGVAATFFETIPNKRAPPEAFLLFGPGGLRKFARTFAAPAAPSTYFIDATAGSYAVTGAYATADRVVATSPGAYAVSGADAELVPPAAPATVVQSAQASLLHGPYVWMRRMRATRFQAPGVTSYSIDAEPGAYVLTGNDADLALAGTFSIDAEPGSYAVTGAADQSLAARAIIAVPGAYVVTGQAASLLATRALTAAPGAYVVTGVAADLVVPGSFSLDAGPGVFILTGQAAGVVAGRLLVAAPGGYAATGIATTFILARAILLSPGVYAVLGSNATVTHIGLAVYGRFDRPSPRGGSAKASPTARTFGAGTPGDRHFDPGTPS